MGSQRYPEWKKLEEKGAFSILSGASAEKAKAQFGDRFIPSRFVVTRPGPEEFKARWCLRGYLDPDVMELAGSGATESPTMSQQGPMLSCQMIVSNGWDLQLGDVRGALKEADALDRKKGSLYSRLPPGKTGKHLWSERCTSLVENLMQSSPSIRWFHTKHV